MKSLFLFLFCCLSFTVWSQGNQTLKKSPQYSKHGFQIKDEYAWMENVQDAELKAWVVQQNESSTSHIDSIGTQNQIARKIKEYDFLSTNPLPDRRGRYFYSILRKDNKTPASLYYRKTLNGEPILVVNTQKMYPEQDAVISSYKPSKNSKYVATQFLLKGSDTKEVRFNNITSGKTEEDRLKDVKYSNVVWNGDAGVFYKRSANQETFAKDSTFQLFYHRMSTAQEADELIFDTSKTENQFSFFVENDRLFIVESNKEETLKSYYSASLKEFPLQFKPILLNDKSGFRQLYYNDDKIYFSSTAYDWGEIRVMDINNPTDQKVIVPQIYTHLLSDQFFLKDYIICKYKNLGKIYLIVYDSTGKFLRKIEVPGQVDFKFKFFNPETKDLFVTLFSRTLPHRNYIINVEKGTADPYYNEYLKPKSTLFPTNYFTTKTATFKSRDGKEVPITIIHKKNITLNGNNPTLLEAYGGFGVVSGISYDTGLLYFLEQGGVYAFAEIRGGGEKGTKWHSDGKGAKKINGLTDFIDAEEFLIWEKYTSPNRLGISGASHGGLVVGVAITQRPELFKVAIPKVGVYDMAKFNRFTVGEHHLDEFGNPEKKEDLEVLLRYSPYHNIHESANYPTTLLIASENDNRVTPFQSYKFAAALQNRSAQKNKIYLKTLLDSGHYGKISNYNSIVEEKAAFYSFLLYHLNR